MEKIRKPCEDAAKVDLWLGYDLWGIDRRSDEEPSTQKKGGAGERGNKRTLIK